jgi:hypothetical protein
MKQNVEIDSAASGGSQVNYMKFVSFPWPQIEATQSILNITFVFKTFLRMDL